MVSPQATYALYINCRQFLRSNTGQINFKGSNAPVYWSLCFIYRRFVNEINIIINLANFETTEYKSTVQLMSRLFLIQILAFSQPYSQQMTKTSFNMSYSVIHTLQRVFNKKQLNKQTQQNEFRFGGSVRGLAPTMAFTSMRKVFQRPKHSLLILKKFEQRSLAFVRVQPWHLRAYLKKKGTCYNSKLMFSPA